ncbi:hypothetical protein [Streptomyces sp. NPDC101776]|uniref:hypothetical protein n=1 Tax=Streptomyces sp. NPDC101776 TaxID=3366146 RepID=UPI003800071D
MTAHPDRTDESGGAVAGSAEHWLLAALDAKDRDAARTRWRTGECVLMPLGRLFSAVRLPQELVLGHIGSQWDPAAADQIVAQAFDGGPVICDPCRIARWYALVPAATAVWHTDHDDWRAAGVFTLGLGNYISVPPVDATSYDPRTEAPYWSMPVTLPGALCEPGHVDRLITTTPDRLARAAQS